MFGIENYIIAAIFCSLTVAFILIVEWKRTLELYRTTSGILRVSIISIILLSIISFMWVLTPIEIITVDVNTSNITIVNVEKLQRITRYNNENYMSETITIDTSSVGVPSDSIKYEYTFGITALGDTIFRSLKYKE